MQLPEEVNTHAPRGRLRFIRLRPRLGLQVLQTDGIRCLSCSVRPVFLASWQAYGLPGVRASSGAVARRDPRRRGARRQACPQGSLRPAKITHQHQHLLQARWTRFLRDIEWIKCLRTGARAKMHGSRQAGPIVEAINCSGPASLHFLRTGRRPMACRSTPLQPSVCRARSTAFFSRSIRSTVAGAFESSSGLKLCCSSSTRPFWVMAKTCAARSGVVALD